jgi:hypothetical protein
VTLLAITHLPEREHGQFDAGDLPLRRLHIDDPERPGLHGLAGIVSFGGALDVPDAGRYPFLRWELHDRHAAARFSATCWPPAASGSM